MKKSREFSAQSIKQLAASLPDTYYGNACNISLKSDCITFRSAVGGDSLRFDDFGISLCCGGEISSEVNMMRQTVSEGDFELYSPGTIYRMDSISDDCRLIGIAMSPFYLKEILPERDLPFFTSVGKNLKVRLDEKEQHLFKQLAELYLQTLLQYGEFSQFGKSLSACILQFVVQTYSSRKVVGNVSKNRSDELAKKFIALLTQTKGTKRTISWFAEKLCVSNHYLSVAVKESSNGSAKDLIDKAVITEIKLLLLHSDLSISQIADKLEFPNSSFMCKYFKAHTGMTPLHYRNK